MLKSVLDKLDGLSEDVKKEYTEKDGMFYLQVEGVDGLELADVGGLRKVLDEVKAERKQLKDNEKELSNAIDKAKVRVTELEASTGGKSKEAIEKLKLELTELHQKELANRDDRITSLTGELSTEKVTTRGQKAFLDAGVNPKRLNAIMKLAHGSARMVEVNGKHIVQVFNDNGHVRSGQGGGDMTMDELAAEFKTDYPEFFDGNGNAGGGAGGGGGEGSGTPPGNLKKMKQSEFDALPLKEQSALMPYDVKTGTVTPQVEILAD